MNEQKNLENWPMDMRRHCLLTFILLLVMPTLTCISYAQDFEIVMARAIQDQGIPNAPVFVGRFSCVTGPDTILELYISNEKGMAYRERGVFGPSNLGVAKFDVHEGKLHIDDQIDQHGILMLSSRMVVAKLGMHTMLVPVGRLHGFCLDMKSGRSRLFNKYLSNRKGDEPIQNSEQLVVPEEFKRYLELPSITATVTSILRERTVSDPTLVVIDKGFSDEIATGMQFEGMSGLTLEISEVKGDHAIARVVFDSWEAEPRLVGSKVSTAVMYTSKN
jgi:hypothetical protein